MGGSMGRRKRDLKSREVQPESPVSPSQGLQVTVKPAKKRVNLTQPSPAQGLSMAPYYSKSKFLCGASQPPHTLQSSLDNCISPSTHFV